MALLKWSDKYSVGVNSIDQQHSGLFAMVNELHDAMMKGQAKGVTEGLLKKLVKYTEEHFSYEERAMETTWYAGLASQRKRHNELTGQVKEFMARYERGDSTINVELLRFLSDWLTKHIQFEDKQYGPWMKQHGVS